MRIIVYVDTPQEPVPREIEVEDLLKGKNVREALKMLGINESNFIRCIIDTVDEETGLKLKFSFEDYELFLNTVWGIRVSATRCRK